MENPNTRINVNAEALDLGSQSLAHIGGSTTSIPSPKNAQNSLFELIGIKEILTAPPPVQWLIEDYMLRESQCQIIGESTIGKTFFSVDMALSIATGRDFMGRTVTEGPVVYINAEGHTGMKWRIKAWEQEFGSIANAAFYLSKQSADFLNGTDIDNVTTAIDIIAKKHEGKLEGIFVDTLHRNMHGDENSSLDFGLFMKNFEQLCQRHGAAGIVNHHPGYGAKDRGRGSSSQRASLDTELLLIKKEQQTLLKHIKLKDGGPLQPPIGYRLRPVTIPWLDVNGNNLTTCVPEFYELDPSNSDTSKRKPVPENPAIAIKAFVKALNGAGTTSKEQWKTVFSDNYGGEDEAMKKAFSRALKDLTKYGVVAEVKSGIYSIGDYSDCPWVDVEDCLSPIASKSLQRDMDTDGTSTGQVSNVNFGT